jgi:hypothetical protein
LLVATEPDEVRKALEKGLLDAEEQNYLIKPVFINDSADYSPISPWQHSKCFISSVNQ